MCVGVFMLQYCYSSCQTSLERLLVYCLDTVEPSKPDIIGNEILSFIERCL